MKACLSFHNHRGLFTKFLLGHGRPPSLGFPFFNLFRLSFFSFSHLFATVIDLLLGLLPVQKIWESVIEMGRFYNGVATWSRRQFCFELFSQISEPFRVYVRLHWANHSDLGIIGKIFCSCRTWIQMMPISVKGDDAIRETKANARHESQWLEKQLARSAGKSLWASHYWFSFYSWMVLPNDWL